MTWTCQISSFCCFFLEMFGGHKFFFWGGWYPWFGLLVMSALGFKARVRSLACFLAWVILRFTSGATPAECIVKSSLSENRRLTRYYLQFLLYFSNLRKSWSLENQETGLIISIFHIFADSLNEYTAVQVVYSCASSGRVKWANSLY